MENYNIAGSHLQGYLDGVSYERVCHALGMPREYGSGDHKTDVEWHVWTPYGVGTVYNWKNGKAYLGAEGTDVVEITDWNIGGHNKETAEFIKTLIV